jgi:hypothetical protein
LAACHRSSATRTPRFGVAGWFGTHGTVGLGVATPLNHVGRSLGPSCLERALLLSGQVLTVCDHGHWVGTREKTKMYASELGPLGGLTLTMIDALAARLRLDPWELLLACSCPSEERVERDAQGIGVAL